MTEKTTKELYAELDVILAGVEAKLVEAEKFAEEHKLIFDYGDPAVTYYPHSKLAHDRRHEGLGNNHFVTERFSDEEIANLSWNLEKHVTDRHYYGYENNDPFYGGWWYPSRFC